MRLPNPNVVCIPRPLAFIFYPLLVAWARLAPRFLADRLRDKFFAMYGTELGEGAYRTTFDAGEVVYKIPRTYWGASGTRCNIAERRAYRGRGKWKGIPVAPCRIAWHWTGMPIIVMACVRPARELDRINLPEWAARIEGSQVGKLGDEWVVYDAGDPPRNQRTFDYIRKAAVPAMYDEQEAA